MKNNLVEYKGFILKKLTICGGSYSIIGYNGDGDTINIPSHFNGFPIIRIGNAVFRDKGLVKITIPDTISSIYTNAFSHNDLTNVHLPDRIKHVAFGAFRNNSLKSVRIPEKISYIGNCAFIYNDLTNVTIPKDCIVYSSSFDRNVKTILI